MNEPHNVSVVLIVRESTQKAERCRLKMMVKFINSWVCFQAAKTSTSVLFSSKNKLLFCTNFVSSQRIKLRSHELSRGPCPL